MPSEIGQMCRTIVQKAKGMKSPCIQITPVFSSGKEELAKLYFFFSKMTKKMEDEVKDFFLVSVEETGAKEVQCSSSDNGFHEFMEIEKEDMPKSNMMFCIHCGAFTSRTKRTSKELKEFFANKKFKKTEISEKDRKEFFNY